MKKSLCIFLFLVSEDIVLASCTKYRSEDDTIFCIY